MATTKKWSQHVTDTSDALDLKDGVFKQADPKKIAKSLKTSAEHSDRRKSDPYRAAMSMLTFYINRAGHTLEAHQRKHLEDAKDELRALFDRPQRATASTHGAGSTRSSGAARKAAPRKTAAKKSERPSS
jgi:hypothetical protein